MYCLKHTALRYSFILLLFVSLFIAPRTRFVHAQQFSFSLSPSTNRVIAKPGITATLPFTLTNTGDPTIVKLQVYRLTIKDSAGSYELLPYSDGLENYPEFSTSDTALKLGEPFLISSQEAVEFDLVVVTPERIEEKDYYFTLVAEVEPTEGFEDTRTIILQGGVGSNIYLTVTKDSVLQSTGEITQFTVQPQYSLRIGDTNIALFDSYKPIPVLLTIANKGKNLIQTSGSITVQSSLTSEIKVVPISKQYILSNSQRLITASSPEGSETSDTNTVILPGNLIGAYTALVNMQIGDAPQQSNLSVQYYVFPFTYTLLLLSITALFFISRLIFKSMHK